ncbi:MAG: tRNA (adenosine(37)-N6)-threonylcarbamoyltransferase complex transferase subunit TsaD [Phycisphaeraceae bacterium]|nr:tRNA (adenosine(37)-N6)-threonylcarbamoyltransferase complex transferase subunit TsaD [Phycisphaeraceae bacterium]
MRRALHTILGIESSCDETAAAVVAGRRVLSNVIASQNDLHEEYGGVVPEIASRAHAERVLPVVRAALAEAGLRLDEVDAVAVGNRPGLIGSLLVGVAAAKGLAWALGVPIIGVDHVRAHLYAPVLCCEDSLDGLLPALGLVVSGGHTSLYRVENFADPQRIGATVDDAVGEAYDKAAAILGIPFPGGPNLDRLAAAGDPGAVDLPVSRLSRESLDFSFSGLKTAILYAARGVPDREGLAKPAVALDDARRRDLAASFQSAAIAAVMLKLERAIDAVPEARSVLVGGGVSANSLLRRKLGELAARRGVCVRLCDPGLCVDNAAMIAGLGGHLLSRYQPAGDPLSLAATPTVRG